ncbi:MAG: VWA domain-containing protein, partial [Candidatus Binatia bacterium]
EEVYEVGAGAELSRLLPHELLALRHPILRRDFRRRFVEAELLQYTLRTVEEKGRGPMIVCLDGSSSMAGDKEIWSKAVSLTLLDMAQRQRRLFRSICFASADMPLQVLDLNRRQRYVADMHKVFELAEYFPGGGTDFQKPLTAALDCLRQSRHRRGDIIFITDGECRVEAQWLSEFKRAKDELGFSLFSVLIDVGSSSLGALKDFSDKITTITQLTSEASRELFVKI